jgi:glycosyltransferase involved in cell wall biosynthesis
LKRPVAFDLTHLVSRLAITSPTGIDQVDLMFAKHFIDKEPNLAIATHYGLRRPHLLMPAVARSIVHSAEELWTGSPGGSELDSFRCATSFDFFSRRAIANRAVLNLSTLQRQITRFRLIQKLRVTHDFRAEIARNSIYLNIAQHLLEFPLFFRWLTKRPDITKVFFLHDLLPLDYPEFFRSGYRFKFDRRVRAIARHASALVVSTEAVADRVRDEMRLRGREGIPIHVAALPSPMTSLYTHDYQKLALPKDPYFVAVGTIEPRKNHLLLLNIWRELAKESGETPTLVIVGARGWETEQVLDLLDRCSSIQPHILWVAGLPGAALQNLLVGARALLMPSFAEGYGLPIVEALSLGIPVIASDIPVFREVSQGRAMLLNALDGPGWQEVIYKMTPSSSPLRATWAAAAARFRQSSWKTYFSNLESFICSL